jgi:outer membrane protein OmpA-like peptidoglycan-associated protein
MKFRSALLGATILALPLVANAQPIAGLYVGGGAGASFMQDEAAKATTPGGHTVGHWLKSDVGPAFNLSLGYGLGNGFRAEVEGTYIYNNLSSPSSSTTGGNEQKYGAMFNVLYDFVGVVPMVQPYVGLGAGYQWTKDDNLHFGPAAFRTDTKGAFAYQAILGAALPIASAPGLSLTADYRFLGLTDGNRSYGGFIPGSSVKLSNDFTHTVMVGFTYAFGAAPAPAPMAPMPAAVPQSPVSRSYLVFFDWDKAVLTDRAKQIVSEAAANSTKVQYTKIEVNGYTDTSGTPAYNQGLSVRRAQTVAAELVKDGVPSASIAISGFGETHLLVSTGPGVREPQNRRVEIIIK